MANELAIDLRDVAKVYRGRVHALQGIEMHVRRGEIFGLLGPNGAGKSTLVKIMMTVLHPTRAQGMVLGKPVGDKQTLARVGYLPENHRFPRYLTGRQTLEFFGAMARVDRRTAKRRASELLETVRMTNWAEAKISSYSKGMMQRIGLAQALMNDPELVLLDEPTDGVDPIGRREILDVLGRLRDRGMTVFINSHALSELESICDRVAILVKGQVASQGTIDELTVARQRYEIEAAGDVAAARTAMMSAAPATWTTVFTSKPLPTTRGAPPPLPGGGTVGAGTGSAVPGGLSAVPPSAAPQTALNYSAALAMPMTPFQRPIDRGALADGTWLEIDGPVLRIGATEPEKVQGLLDALRQRGIVIRRLQAMRVSLEDLFIEAVTDPTTGARVTPGAGAWTTPPTKVVQ